MPLIASATGTFFFRQFFMSVPDELLEAARLDGATPWRFFVDILIPLSKTMIAAILIIMFVVGWNQYLWPLIMTTKEENYTLVIGIKQIYQVLAEGWGITAISKGICTDHSGDLTAGACRAGVSELVRQGPRRE